MVILAIILMVLLVDPVIDTTTVMNIDLVVMVVSMAIKVITVMVAAAASIVAVIHLRIDLMAAAVVIEASLKVGCNFHNH